MIDRIGVAFGESSTWRSIVLLLLAAGLELDPEQQEAILKAGLAVAGLIGLFFRRGAIKP